MVMLGLLPSASPPGVGGGYTKSCRLLYFKAERVIGHSYHSDTTFYSTELWKSREKTLKKTDSCYQLFFFAPECQGVYARIISVP